MRSNGELVCCIASWPLSQNFFSQSWFLCVLAHALVRLRWMHTLLYETPASMGLKTYWGWWTSTAMISKFKGRVYSVCQVLFWKVTVEHIIRSCASYVSQARLTCMSGWRKPPLWRITTKLWVQRTIKIILRTQPHRMVCHMGLIQDFESIPTSMYSVRYCRGRGGWCDRGTEKICGKGSGVIEIIPQRRMASSRSLLCSGLNDEWTVHPEGALSWTSWLAGGRCICHDED